MIQILGIEISLFWIGCIGSVSVDLVAAAHHAKENAWPVYYQKAGFYVTRLALALLGGVLVAVYEANTAPLALQIGASTTAIFATLAGSFKPPTAG
jgi:hypothetical protein